MNIRKQAFFTSMFFVIPNYSFGYEPLLPKGTAYVTVVPSGISGAVPCGIHDKKKTEEIWNEFAPKFDYKNWQYVVPDAPFYTIFIIYDNKSLTLISSAPVFENTPNVTVKSYGLSSSSDKEDTSSKEVEFRDKQAAFDSIMKACKDWKE